MFFLDMLPVRSVIVQSRRLASGGHGPAGPPITLQTIKAM